MKDTEIPLHKVNLTSSGSLRPSVAKGDVSRANLMSQVTAWAFRTLLFLIVVTPASPSVSAQVTPESA